MCGGEEVNGHQELVTTQNGSTDSSSIDQRWYNFAMIGPPTALRTRAVIDAVVGTGRPRYGPLRIRSPGSSVVSMISASRSVAIRHTSGVPAATNTSRRRILLSP